jgi:methylthioribose-1-phosphate isomerase
MRVGATHYRPIWLAADGWRVEIIDQTRLPFTFATVALETATNDDPESWALVRG